MYIALDGGDNIYCVQCFGCRGQIGLVVRHDRQDDALFCGSLIGYNILVNMSLT